jgi:hypothetical protein
MVIGGNEMNNTETTPNPEATKILNTIAACIDRRWGLDRKDEARVSYDGGTVMDMRCWDAFTPNPCEEDDDHPRFTGIDEIKGICEDAIEGTEFGSFSIAPSEKRWFEITIK